MPKNSGSYQRWLGLAARLQHELDGTGPSRVQQVGGASASERSLLGTFDELVTCLPIRRVSRSLFRDQYYARAVEEAFKCLNNAVKAKSGLHSNDGADLMRNAFSPNSPVLGLNRLTTVSERDEQRGYMEIYAGSMIGIRNPRAHDHEFDDDPRTALTLLILSNHLMEKLDSTTRLVRKKAKGSQ